MKQNYQKILDGEIEKIKSQQKKPTLLLHSCCAPCSSYVLEYLSGIFDITVFYYNPNIYPEAEFEKRAEEQKRLISEMGCGVKIIIGKFESDKFYDAAKGLEDAPEGGERCKKCFYLRLSETAKLAKEKSFDYFCTTLTISPLKNAEVLNDVGREISEKYGVRYLFSDFKKKDGYKRSIYLSSLHNLYRQNYCGCIFSQKSAQTE